MKQFATSFKKIYQEDRSLFWWLLVNFLISGVLFIVSVATLNPKSATVKLGYSDIEGYRDGAWNNRLVFPMFAVLFGVLHNFLAIKIFDKHGKGFAKAVAMITTGLILGTIIVMRRLLGES